MVTVSFGNWKRTLAEAEKRKDVLDNGSKKGKTHSKGAHPNKKRS